MGDGWAGNKAGAALVSVPFSGVGRKGLLRINVTQWNEVFPRNVFYSQNSSSLSANSGACCRSTLARGKNTAKFVLSSLMVGGWIMQCY